MNTTHTRVQRAGHLEWLTVSDLKVSPQAQRELRPGWAAQIANDFNPDRFTALLVSHRDGNYYVVDGQHRVEAMRILGWDHGQQVQCWVHEGLNESQEADLFLWHNSRKNVEAFDKFQIGVVAGRPIEMDIDRIVRLQNLKISRDASVPGSISAVVTLREIYNHDPGTLARTLKIAVGAYGDDGLAGPVLRGIGLVAARYNGELDDDKLTARLGSARGGIGALNSRANINRQKFGTSLPQCYAAAIVDLFNSGKGGKKLPSWWKTA